MNICGSRMTEGDNAKYILCHSGTSESEVIESKKKKWDVSANAQHDSRELFRLTLNMTVGGHSERSGNEVEESKSKKKSRGNLLFLI